MKGKEGAPQLTQAGQSPRQPCCTCQSTEHPGPRPREENRNEITLLTGTLSEHKQYKGTEKAELCERKRLEKQALHQGDNVESHQHS